ncbi:unnamed protein product [Spodoptera littoralis]|uniref:THAP-type domain-containing protein n=1 Tax=Spodoptera littoralis TaxID=7109 RepID=A0A9P0I375_SPOLI|nr:unnamed protein product [Spodoptera littoralis]CAH1639195.1 unnamed protein product [Spodoptera littoralis]
MSSMSATHCAIENCRTTILNKPPGVSFHPCPTTNEMRKRWLRLLKNKCSMLDWYKSQICSKHFEPKFFDSQRKLKENAVPTIFAPSLPKLAVAKSVKDPPRTRIDRLLHKLTQAELTANIKTSMSKLKEPADLDAFVSDDLKCTPDAPKEAVLWLMVKKQEHLNNRLMDLVVQTKKHVEILQNNSEEAKVAKRENEHTIESLRYVVKCLQEKHATLEEQIEILTSVESR